VSRESVRATTIHPTSPLQVNAGVQRDPGSGSDRVERARPRVAALMVTWNRWSMADRAIRAVAGQRFGTDAIDLVVVDNGSADGTAEELASRWRPDTIVDNDTDDALRPAFRAATRKSNGAVNAGGFRSMTIIRNTHNLGGCGGFNTAMGYVAHALDRQGDSEPVDFVWLVDDDIDLPEDALARLEARAATDDRIGIVGSRTVDIEDRRRTIESTIYFDFIRGRFADEPRRDDPRHADHQTWVSQSGGTRGSHDMSGARDVDVVSACSLLARWSAVREVGLWDGRYFIYCDDADWCLRFGKAGYRVVCDFDAVVYHTPWNHKLTPGRLYYAQRNIIWTMRKVLEKWPLRYATFRWLASILFQAFRAMWHRRMWHAELFRRTARDVVAGRGGKLDPHGSEPGPVGEVLREAGLLEAGKRIVVVCLSQSGLADAARVRSACAENPGAGAGSGGPEWIELVVLGPRAKPPGGASPGRRYVPQSRWNRFRTLLWSLRARPDVYVVFDQCCPLWLAGARANVHIDRRQPDVARIERDGLGPKSRFLARWAWTLVRSLWHSFRVRPEASSSALS